MRNQHPGIPQPQSKQQKGFNDMQLWQQHLMYRQMLEIQQQRHLQQLDTGGRQQNSFGQLSDIARQSTIRQSDPILSGMPMNETNYMSGTMQHGGSPVHGISNGVIFQHNQGQPMQTMGFVPQNVDQSLSGAPVSSMRFSSNHHPQSQEMVNNWNDTMNNEAGDGTEKTTMQQTSFNYFQNNQCVPSKQGCLQDDASLTKQGFPGKSSFVNPSLQVAHGQAQVNRLAQSVQFQEFHGGQKRLQENRVTAVGPTSGQASLDPIEEKLLFGTDNDGNWDGSSGKDTKTSTGGNLLSFPSGSNDHLGAFPSTQSGSWSALMLDALDASRSETGLQEEWSGLSYQKAEASIGNQNNGKQQPTWNDNNYPQSASSLTFRSFPLFNDNEASPSFRNVANTQQAPTRFAFKQEERARTDVSRESSEQSSKETSHKLLDHSHQLRHFVSGQTHLDDDSNSAWSAQLYVQSGSARHSADMEFNMQNTQQVLPQYNASNLLSDRSNGWKSWNINESLTPSGDGTLKIPDREGMKWNGHSDGINRTIHMESDRGVGMWKAGGSQAPNLSGGLESDYSYMGSGKMCNEDSFTGNAATLMNSNALKLTTEINQTVAHQHHHDHGKHITARPSRFTNGEVSTRGDSLFVGNDSKTLATNSQMSLRQSVQNTLWPPRSQEDGYVGQSHFASHAISQNSMDFHKGHLADLQNAKGAEELQSSANVRNRDSPVSSYDGSTNSHRSPSHNMLELLHKVDQSRNNDNIPQVKLSDHSAPMPEAAIPDGSVFLQHNHSSGLQDFGLKLAPPSQWKPVLDRNLHSQPSLQTADHFGPKNLDSGARGRDTPWPSSTTSAVSLPLVHKSSQSESSSIKSSLYGQTSKEGSPSGIRDNPVAVVASTRPQARNQFAEQQQQQSGLFSTGKEPMNPFPSHSFGSQINAFAKHASRVRETLDPRDVADQSTHASMQYMASRIQPLNPYPSADTGPVDASQFHPFRSGSDQLVNANIHPQNSGQQETKFVNQPSATFGIPRQQGGFSTMMHNLSGQQHLHPTQSQKIPSPRESTSPSPTSIETDVGNNRKGRSSSNSQNFSHQEEYPGKVTSSQDVQPQKVDGTSKRDGASHPSAGNSAFSVSSLVQLHQQEVNRERQSRDPSLDSQKEHVPAQNASSNQDAVGSYGEHPKSLYLQKPNYSLLQQMQAMKGAESDASKRLGKKLKGEGFGSETLPMDHTANQSLVYGQNTVPGDVKMLSFSSRDNVERSGDTSSKHFFGREKPTDILLTSAQHDLTNQTHSLTKMSSSNFMSGSEHTQIDSQMAPSWFGQIRNFKNSPVISTYDGPGNSQRMIEAPSQHCSFVKVSEGVDDIISVKEKDDAPHTSPSFLQITPSTTLATHENLFSPYYPTSNVIGNNLVLTPMKRKTATAKLLPWHKEVTQGSRVLQNISKAELDWAQVSNRLIEKVKDEIEMIEDGFSISRPRRRLILTTQLMQQLLSSVPAAFLTGDSTASYESVTYIVSKFALRDACSAMSCSGTDSDTENRVSKKLKTSETESGNFLAKSIEGFIGRSRMLESDLLRFERKPSILDLRAECHDLDRGSIINRFAKFHGRVQMDSAESSSSTPENAPRRIFPQRQVTAFSVKGNPPEGVNCLPL